MGAQIYHRISQGNTLLHYAVLNKRHFLISWLLDIAKMDPYQLNDEK